MQRWSGNRHVCQDIFAAECGLIPKRSHPCIRIKKENESKRRAVKLLYNDSRYLGGHRSMDSRSFRPTSKLCVDGQFCNPAESHDINIAHIIDTPTKDTFIHYLRTLRPIILYRPSSPCIGEIGIMTKNVAPNCQVPHGIELLTNSLHNT